MLMVKCGSQLPYYQYIDQNASWLYYKYCHTHIIQLQNTKRAIFLYCRKSKSYLTKPHSIKQTYEYQFIIRFVERYIILCYFEERIQVIIFTNTMFMFIAR